MIDILITEYMESLIKRQIPFVFFYDNNQILEGDELEWFKLMNNSTKGMLEGYLHRHPFSGEETYWLKEPKEFDVCTKGVDSIKSYLEGQGNYTVYRNYEDLPEYKRKPYSYVVKYSASSKRDSYHTFKEEEQAEEYIMEDVKMEIEHLLTSSSEFTCHKGYDKVTLKTAYGYEQTWSRLWLD